LEIESSSRYRKYKESAHMACLTKWISQNSLDIAPTLIPLISNEVTNWERLVVALQILNSFIHILVLKCSVFTPQMVLAVATK
jgi:hypothetical protein